MNLWIGAELEADVADSFREARKRVENAVNRVILSKSYNLPLNNWDCIAIVRADKHFAERVRYSGKSHEMDFRLCINHTEFKAANSPQQDKMIFIMLQRSLELLAGKISSSAALKELQSDLLIAEKNAVAENLQPTQE